MRIFDLSHTITDGMAVYPGDIPPRIRHDLTHESDGVMATTLSLSCHAGTHVDTPYHFRIDRPGLADLPLEAFSGTARVLQAPVHPAAERPPPVLAAALWEGFDPAGLDFVLFRTGWERYWGTPRYYENWPSLAPDLARRLAGAGLKGVGLDSPSSDPQDVRTCHDLFAAAGMINIENLAHLAALPPEPFLFCVWPLKIAGVEASPVRAVALFDGRVA
jgi:arylformamidase